MDLNKRLNALKDTAPVTPREEKIRETVDACQEVCFLGERDTLLNCWEFLWTQFSYTRKRWWALQGILLCLAGILISDMEIPYYRMRSAGVIGCLFVVLMIPELWRNKESDSVQVEAACLYSLRQIYAARITLFGLVDVALLTGFCLILGSLGFTWMDVVSQFLLPVTVTASICFSLLCGKRNWGETFSVATCLVWGGVWWMLLLNEQIYQQIVPAVWLAVFGGSLAFLVLSVRRAVRTTNQVWEVAFS